MNRSQLYLLIASFVMLLGCSHIPPPTKGAPVTLQARIVDSISAMVPQNVPATGTLHARESASISAQVPGRIRQVLVKAGDHVRAGQLLVVLDDAAMQSAVDQAAAAEQAASRQEAAAQSEATLAAATLARYQVLKTENSVSPQEFDEVEKRAQAAQLRAASYGAQAEQARAAVSGARTQLGYTALKAPFAGVITARLADPGTLATPGVPLLQLDGAGPLQVIATVDESMIGSVQLGLKVPLAVDGANGAFDGSVAQIIPAADPASRSFQVKLDLPAAKNLHPGMFATAEFPGTVRRAILAPESAIVERGSLACVYVVGADAIARLRYVTIGAPHSGQVEVLSGLSAGERLVDKPGDRDYSGARIEAQI